MSLFLLCLSFRLWCLCFLDVFAVWLGSRKLWGAKCWYSQWQDEPYKSTELIDVMYDTVRDCFGKEAASYCKDTAIYCMCVCVCVSCKIAMKSQCQAIFCPSQQHWKNHCRYICVCWRRHRVNAMCPGSPPPLPALQLPWQRTKRLYHVPAPVTTIYKSSQALALCVYIYFFCLNLAFDHVAGTVRWPWIGSVCRASSCSVFVGSCWMQSYRDIFETASSLKVKIRLSQEMLDRFKMSAIFPVLMNVRAITSPPSTWHVS